jgi:hypothetical protein
VLILCGIANFGPPQTREAASYFEDLGFIRPDNMNPADFIMDALGAYRRVLL